MVDFRMRSARDQHTIDESTSSIIFEFTRFGRKNLVSDAYGSKSFNGELVFRGVPGRWNFSRESGVDDSRLNHDGGRIGTEHRRSNSHLDFTVTDAMTSITDFTATRAWSKKTCLEKSFKSNRGAGRFRIFGTEFPFSWSVGTIDRFLRWFQAPVSWETQGRIQSLGNREAAGKPSTIKSRSSFRQRFISQKPFTFLTVESDLFFAEVGRGPNFFLFYN